MRRPGWSGRVPVRQAVERDEEAVAVWKAEVWPDIKARRATSIAARASAVLHYDTNTRSAFACQIILRMTFPWECSCRTEAQMSLYEARSRPCNIGPTVSLMLKEQPSAAQKDATTTEEPDSSDASVRYNPRRLIVWAAVAATACFASVGVYPIGRAYLENQPWVTKIVQQHFAATAGLPCIAALAFLIVITFEARYEAIEMEFFGIMKFKGAAGPIVLWVLCVITMACCVRMLW
jgi:hypothetical protein